MTSARSSTKGSGRRLAAVAAGLALAAAALAFPPPDQSDPDAAATPPTTPPPDAIEGPPASPPRRVAIAVSRDEQVLGEVELEDETIIVLRTHPFGEVRSFLKSRVREIIELVAPAPDQTGRVVLKNGRSARGVVVDDGFDEVTMIVEGIRMRFPREQVNRVVLEPTFDQRYELFKASLGKRITPRHLALCRWLMEEQRYDLAKPELIAVIKGMPQLDEARQMLTIVEAHLAMGSNDGRGNDGRWGATGTDERASGPVDYKDLLPDELISNDDVNLIRVYEIDFNDPPEVALSPDTIREFLERYGSSNLLPRSAAERTALFRADPIEVVRLMFQLRARDLYPQIQVLSEPRSLNLFRQRVHNTWLMNGCATSRCHAGPYAGSLFLHRRNSRDARVRYTNFLTLERLALEAEWPLINYDAPMDSLIIQYGLPREVARRPHPEVKGWKPVFSRGNQRLLRFAIEWIESMMRPRPQYPVEYEPPRLGDVDRQVQGRSDR